uniref:Low density lipoprotein receptor n=1 Tax=Rhipicephalus zambeziensis TaxID=60191 RepID=A0A224YSS6_9ACAR
MHAFIERNSAEETMTTEPGLVVENGTAVAGTTDMSHEVHHVTNHDYAHSTHRVEGSWENATTTSTASTNASSAETTTMPMVTNHGHESHASLTIHDNGTTTVSPESSSTMAAAANVTGEGLHNATAEAAMGASTPVEKNDTQHIPSHNSTCLGFTCNSGEMCVDHSGVCDGIYDCKDASDEVNCVQLKDAVVHGRKGVSWMPACGDTWDDALSDSVCREMGFEKASETSIIALESPYAMSLRHSNKSHEQASVLQSLTLSNETCNTKVTMKCHHYQCGHWNATLAASSGNSSESGTMDAGHSGHWPSIGVLSSKDRHCAAHLISDRWLLTSASCLNESDASSWTFRFLLSHNASSAPHYAVSGILFNHGLNTSRHTDVALVRLNHTVAVSDHAIPICLPDKKAEPKNCVIAGMVTSTADHAHRQVVTPVHIVKTSQCHVDHAEHDGSTLCVQSLNHTTPLCQLATKAALMCTGHRGQWELRGWVPQSTIQRLCSEQHGDGNATAALHALNGGSVLHSKHWVLDIVGHGLAVN